MCDFAHTQVVKQDFDLTALEERHKSINTLGDAPVKEFSLQVDYLSIQAPQHSNLVQGVSPGPGFALAPPGCG
jgi:hypothetical protein